MRLYKHRLLAVLLAFTATHCTAFYAARSEKIAVETELRLSKGEFDEIYDDLDEMARSLTPKEEFVERANTLVAFMKGSDQDLRFVKARDGGVNQDFMSDIYFVYHSLGNGGKKIEVEIWISINGGSAELYDVCARPFEDSTVYRTHCLTNALRKI